MPHPLGALIPKELTTARVAIHHRINQRSNRHREQDCERDPEQQEIIAVERIAR